MILPQDIDLRVLVFDRPAVEEQKELSAKSYCDGNDRREMKCVRLVVVAFNELSDGERNQDE